MVLHLYLIILLIVFTLKNKLRQYKSNTTLENNKHPNKMSKFIYLLFTNDACITTLNTTMLKRKAMDEKAADQMWQCLDLGTEDQYLGKLSIRWQAGSNMI